MSENYLEELFIDEVKLLREGDKIEIDTSVAYSVEGLTAPPMTPSSNYIIEEGDVVTITKVNESRSGGSLNMYIFDRNNNQIGMYTFNNLSLTYLPVSYVVTGGAYINFKYGNSSGTIDFEMSIGQKKKTPLVSVVENLVNEVGKIGDPMVDSNVDRVYSLENMVAPSSVSDDYEVSVGDIIMIEEFSESGSGGSIMIGKKINGSSIGVYTFDSTTLKSLPAKYTVDHNGTVTFRYSNSSGTANFKVRIRRASKVSLSDAVTSLIEKVASLEEKITN